MINDIAIIIPSLDPNHQLGLVVDGMAEAGFSRIVLVDDGSDAEHKKVFDEVCEKHPECIRLTHEVNKGKGRALKTGFAYVADSLPDVCGVITIDGDGQHHPEDAVRLAEALRAGNGELVLGVRDFSRSNKDVPWHNGVGNRLTSFFFHLLFGTRCSDTQTGLRAVPASRLREFCDNISGERFEYEMNMLIYASESGMGISEVPIKTIYDGSNEHSHFNVVKDSFKIYVQLFGRSQLPKQMASSLLCTILDLGIFTLLNRQVDLGGLDLDLGPLELGIGYQAKQLFFATVIARIISASCNFTINRHVVFKSTSSVQKSFPRYIALMIVQMLLSWLLVTLITFIAGKTGFIQTIFKLLVDLFLCFFSYAVQKYWVFKNK